MRTVLSLAVGAALLLGCGPGNKAVTKPSFARADAALVTGDAVNAGNHYYAMFRRAERDGDEASKARALAGLRNATHSLRLPLVQRAQELVRVGAGAAAAEMLLDLYASRPFLLYSEPRRGRPRTSGGQRRFFRDAEVVDGTQRTMTDAMAQAIGLDLGAESASIGESMVWLKELTHRYLVKNRVGDSYEAQQMGEVIKELERRGMAEIERALERKEWATALRATTALRRFAMKRDRAKIGALHAAAEKGFADSHRAAALNHAAKAPARAAVHAAMAIWAGADDPQLTAMRNRVQLGGGDIAFKPAPGPCAATVRAALAGMPKPVGKPRFVVEIKLDQCTVMAQQKSRQVAGGQYDHQTVTGSGYDAEPVYETREICKKEAYCLDSPPAFRRKSYTWKCPQSSIRYHYPCKSQRVRVRTRWVKRNRKYTKRVWRKTTRNVPYTVHRYRLRGRAKIIPANGRAVTVRLNHDRSSEYVGMARMRKRLQIYIRAAVQRKISSMKKSEKKIVAPRVAALWKAGAKAAAVELESRALLQLGNDWPLSEQLADALGSTPWFMARALGRKDKPFVGPPKPPNFPESVRVGPPSKQACEMGFRIPGTKFRSLKGVFRNRLVCPVLRNLGYTDETWAAELLRLRPQLETLPLAGE